MLLMHECTNLICISIHNNYIFKSPFKLCNTAYQLPILRATNLCICGVWRRTEIKDGARLPYMPANMFVVWHYVC